MKTLSQGLLMILAGFAIIYYLNGVPRIDTSQIVFDPEVKADIGASFSVQDNTDSTTYNAPSGSRDQFTVDGRPGEKCYLHRTDLLIDHGNNGDCFVIDINHNYWFVNPAGGRVLLSSCPMRVEESAAAFAGLKEPANPYPGTSSLQDWSAEQLESMKCPSGLVNQLYTQSEKLMNRGSK